MRILAMAALLAALPAPAAPPARVVALAPSAAEILFALGAGPRVMGLPDAAKGLPGAQGKTLLGGFAPDLERVAALRPDLVVVSKDGTDRAAYERLTALGYRVVVTSGTTLEGVLEDIRRVGAALAEAPRADALVAALSRRITAAEAAARRRGTAPRAVALIWPDPPVAAGPGTFIGDLLHRAGARNLVPDSAGLWPRVSLETLAGWNPDVLVVPDAAESRELFVHAFATPAMRLVPAVRAGRVVRIPGDLLERPGPGLVEALERLVVRLEDLR